MASSTGRVAWAPVTKRPMVSATAKTPRPEGGTEGPAVRRRSVLEDLLGPDDDRIAPPVLGRREPLILSRDPRSLALVAPREPQVRVGGEPRRMLVYLGPLLRRRAGAEPHRAEDQDEGRADARTHDRDTSCGDESARRGDRPEHP